MKQSARETSEMNSQNSETIGAPKRGAMAASLIGMRLGETGLGTRREREMAMDTDGNFKTIGFPSVKRSTDYNNQDSKSRPDLHWCLQQAKLIVGSYRRDEAHDPETFASALSLVLSDFSVELVEYAADPRTGIVKEFPMGLPNVGQVREFLEYTQQRKDRIERYAAMPKALPRAPEAIKPKRGYSYGEFLDMANRGEVKRRPIGRFETAKENLPSVEQYEADRAALIEQIGEFEFDRMRDEPRK